MSLKFDIINLRISIAYLHEIKLEIQDRKSNCKCFFFWKNLTLQKNNVVQILVGFIKTLVFNLIQCKQR